MLFRSLVRADRNFAKKALVQLLENAAKYSPRNQPITIAAELIGTFVMTSVADQGSGIAESEQRLIFEKFYRGRDHPPLNPWNWNGIAHCECDYQGARWLAEGYKPAELRLHHFFHFTDRLAPVP